MQPGPEGPRFLSLFPSLGLGKGGLFSLGIFSAVWINMMDQADVSVWTTPPPGVPTK